MMAMTRVIKVLLMITIPGALVVFAAYVLAVAVGHQMRLGEGPPGRRFARAVSAGRLPDGWSHSPRRFL